MKRHLAQFLALTFTCVLAGFASGSQLRVQPASGRAAQMAIADSAARKFALSSARLMGAEIANRIKEGRWDRRFPLSLPMVIRTGGESAAAVLAAGKFHANGFKRMGGPDLVLQFDSSGSGAFTSTYQSLLQSVFDTAKPTLNLLFGSPSVGGTVHVANYDATIGDRNAVAGGYYVANNGAGTPEIRFPVYSSNEAAAVNFVHCLLLAYLGPDGYSTDAFEEGLVRAVVMKVVRTASAMPASLDPASLEAALDNSYDAGTSYDWDNQRALGGPQFIAPNLISQPLPASGGAGLFLARYEMSGSAWAKVLTEYPTFASLLNQAVYANPSLGSNVPGLITQGQTIITQLRGSDPTVEGYSFSDWMNRQYVLQTGLTQGKKLYLGVTPITSGLSGSDFGVFIVEVTYFSTDNSGNETLLSGTCYPIFWDDSFNRVFTNAQDEIIQIAASQGSVAPNFPDLYGGVAYRATLDAPVGDDIARVSVPAGGIATATSSQTNDFYGTVSGASLNAGDTLSVHLSVGNTDGGTYAVSNNAFGGVIGSLGNYNSAGIPLTVTLTQVHGGVSQTLLTRRIDKGGFGPLGINLNVGSEGSNSIAGGLPAGVSMVGFPIDPFSSDAPSIFGVPAGQLLMGRYNSGAASYDFYPQIESPTIGHAYFINLPAANTTFAVPGRLQVAAGATVALKPGWNMISAPLAQAIQTSSVEIVHAADFPTTYAEGLGTTLGLDFFKFTPGAADPASGVPEGGTFTAATEFDPNVGYFVRVLSPEGVTLLFQQATQSGQVTGGHLIGGTGRGGSHALVNGGRRWSMQVVVTAPQGKSTSYIGASTTATEGFDAAEDSTLPPAIGGFQLQSVQGGRYYRDFRPIGQRQTYSMELDGLSAGTPYQVTFKAVTGNPRVFKVTDLATGRTFSAMAGSTFHFTSTGSVARFLVATQGQ